MALVVDVTRDAGHPWDSRPGFDQMSIDADSKAELDRAIGQAESKFWSPWIVGFTGDGSRHGCVLYKPCQIAQRWVDTPSTPHPGCKGGELLSPQATLSEEEIEESTRRAIARQ